MSVSRTVILFLFFCVLPTLAWTQRDGTRGGSPRVPNENRDSFPVLDSLPFSRVPDSVRIRYIFADNPNEEYIDSDSLINRKFQHYDPTRQHDRPSVHLGNVGAPARPLYYESPNRRGFNTGFHQFDIYKKKVEELPFFTLQPAFTKLYYSQGNDQNDSRVGALFGRSFDGGMRMTIEYERLLHSLRDDEININQNVFYKYQAARHTNARVGFSYTNNSQHYQAFLMYQYNQHRNIDHGGIVPTTQNDSLLQYGNDISRVSIDVYQSEETATTRHNENSLAFVQHYRFGGTIDTLGNAQRSFRLSHRLVYQNQAYKFSETNPSADYYNTFLTDERGLRQFIRVQSVENHFSVNTFRPQSQNVRQQKDLLDLGLLHRSNWIEEEAADSLVQNLFLTGKWKFNPNQKLRIEIKGHLGLWHQAGDYLAQGDAFLDLNQWGQIRLFAKQQLFEPNLLQTRAFLSQRILWNNQWNKTLETAFGGVWSYPKWQLSVGLEYFILNNWIYFDAQAQPNQDTGTFGLGQFFVEKNIRLGKFHLDTRILLSQNTADERLRMPTLFALNSLYFEGRLFKKRMLARAGVDFMWNEDYFADTYMPAIGQFYLQNTAELKGYPLLDFFFNFKIDRFRAFVKLENLTSIWSNEVFMQTPYFPQKTMYFRFGVTWVLLDMPSNTNNNTSQSRTRR